MSSYQVQTPIVFIVFKRPETTIKVFQAIRQIKPAKLLVIADGPHPDRPEEAQKCAAVRAIIETIDWDCEAIKNYADVNLGIARRVASGLTWAFNLVEEAIILEDDCIPHPSFFPFAEELLSRYRNDSRIAAITGSNVQFGRKRNNYSYYFSRYYNPWGWATWRRAWRHFDLEMKLWPEFQDGNYLKDILADDRQVYNWAQTYQAAYEGRLKAWGFQWMFACWTQNSLTITPNANLVTNIGYGAGSTNTSDPLSPYNNMPVGEMSLPLQHPPFVAVDWAADEFTENTLFDYHPPLLRKVYKKINKVFKFQLNPYLPPRLASGLKLPTAARRHSYPTAE